MLSSCHWIAPASLAASPSASACALLTFCAMHACATSSRLPLHWSCSTRVAVCGCCDAFAFVGPPPTSCSTIPSHSMTTTKAEQLFGLSFCFPSCATESNETVEPACLTENLPIESKSKLIKFSMSAFSYFRLRLTSPHDFSTISLEYPFAFMLSSVKEHVW